MTDFNNPQSTQDYLVLLADIVDNNKAALQWMEGYSGAANIPTDAKRWNPSSSRFEYYDGSSWQVLSALYEIKVRDSDKLNGQTASYYRNAGNLNNGVLPSARFNDTAHGNRGNGSLHSVATTGANGFMSSSDKSKLDGIQSGATADQTASEILSALLGVDGPGCGLNADYVDNYHASSLLSRSNHTGTQSYTTISGLGALATKSTVSGSEIITSAPGNYVESNITDNNLPGGGSYTKCLEFKMFRSGTVRIRFGVKPLAGDTAYCKVYRNGIAVGSEHSNTSQYNYSSEWEDYSVNKGDLLQVYTKNTGYARAAICGDSALMMHGQYYNYESKI